MHTCMHARHASHFHAICSVTIIATCGLFEALFSCDTMLKWLNSGSPELTMLLWRLQSDLSSDEEGYLSDEFREPTPEEPPQREPVRQEPLRQEPSQQGSPQPQTPDVSMDEFVPSFGLGVRLDFGLGAPYSPGCNCTIGKAVLGTACHCKIDMKAKH